MATLAGRILTSGSGGDFDKAQSADERSAEWRPLEPKLVVEACYDHFSGGRFRHGTRLVRWRPDKAPRQCRMD